MQALHPRALTPVGKVKLWPTVDMDTWMPKKTLLKNTMGFISHSVPIPIGYPSQLYGMCLGLHSNHLTCRAVESDMPLIIQDLLASNPTITVHQFDIANIKRLTFRLTFRVKSNSKFHNLCYTEEKSIMFSFIRHSLLSTTNPESFTSTLCVWHQAPQSLKYTARAMLHNQTWQTLPA